MTRKEIWRDFFKKTVLTALIAAVLFYWCKLTFTRDRTVDYFLVLLICGIPFGIRRMFVWLVPFGHDFAATVGIFALNFIVGGIIGIFVLAWKLLVATWYIPLTVYRLLTVGKGDETDFHIEE